MLERCRYGLEVTQCITEFGHTSSILYLQKDSRTLIYRQHNISICTSKQP